MLVSLPQVRGRNQHGPDRTRLRSFHRQRLRRVHGFAPGSLVFACLPPEVLPGQGCPCSWPALDTNGEGSGRESNPATSGLLRRSRTSSSCAASNRQRSNDSRFLLMEDERAYLGLSARSTAEHLTNPTCSPTPHRTSLEGLTLYASRPRRRTGIVRPTGLIRRGNLRSRP